jgi:hypothetical protein
MARVSKLAEHRRSYVAIERAVVLGSEYEVEGRIFIVEHDGRLRPIDGKELSRLYANYPNFVRGWKL